MVSPDAFISRVMHTLAGAFLFAYATAPFVWAGTAPLRLLHPWMAPVAAALSVLSGLYNASKARPKDFRNPAKYRALVYAKLPFIVAFTPTVVTYLGEERGAFLRLAVAVLMFVLGASARFTRESETLRPPNK